MSSGAALRAEQDRCNRPLCHASDATIRILGARLLRLLAAHLHHFTPAAIHAHCGQRAAPDAAGVDGQQVGSVDQAERAPVAEGHRLAGGGAARDIEPGLEAGWGGFCAFLGLELQFAVVAAETDARQRVDHEAPAVGACQVVAPAVGFIVTLFPCMIYRPM